MKYIFATLFVFGVCSIDSTGTAFIVAICLTLIGAVGLYWEGRKCLTQ